MESLQDKEQRKKGICKFSRPQQCRVDLSRLELEKHIEEHINEAITKKWIKVYLQVNVRGLSGRVCGAEALARWSDPKYGLIYPGDFIPVLERINKIHLLDLYVFEEVCKRLQEKRVKREEVFPVSLNFSRLDFDSENLIEILDEIVNHYGVSKSNLHIEITESVVMHNEEYMKFMIRSLHDAGYQVWMDDFGSGYSSLNLLKDFEFDTFKIDMCFLSDMGKKSLIIISSILYMAKEIGIHTVAEGVETEEQYRFLKLAGCERMQGYYFGRPEPMENWLSSLVRKNGVETSEETYLYDKVGLVNIVSPTPFVLDRLDETPAIYGFETSLPMALLLEEEGEVRHLNFTKPYIQVLSALGYEKVSAFQDVLNSRKNALVVTIREAMDAAKDSLSIETMDFIYKGNYCQVQARRAAGKKDSTIFILRIDILSDAFSFRKLNDLDEALRPIYSVYDAVLYLDLKNHSFRSVYKTGKDRVLESDRLVEDILTYVQKNVYSEDCARCTDFLDPDKMWERLEKSEEGYLLSYFRVKGKKGKYVWKRFTLIRSCEGDEEQRVVFGIHTLNMEKLAQIKEETEVSLQGEEEGNSDEADFFK